RCNSCGRLPARLHRCRSPPLVSCAISPLVYTGCIRSRAFTQGVEEPGHLAPDRSAATEPLPMPPDQPDQLVTGVQGRDPVLARALHPIDEERLHLWLEGAQHRVTRL